MRADELARTLGDRLSKDQFTVVVRPDHPFLFAEPDLLVGLEGRLVAIFIPKQYELQNPDQILARLATARLALPSHMRCILVAEWLPVGHLWEHNFHEIIRPSDYRGLNAFIRDKTAGLPIKPPAPELRQHIFKRFHLLLSETLSRDKTHPEGREPEELIGDLVNRENFLKAEIPKWWGKGEAKALSRNKIIVQKEDTFLAARSFRTPRMTLAKLRPLCVSSVKLMFALDLGVLYFRQDAAKTVNIIIVDDMPKGRFDPLKPLKAAAFAGWSLTRATDIKEIIRFAERIQRKMEALT